MNRMTLVLVILTSMGCGVSTQMPQIGSPNNSTSTGQTQSLTATMTSTGTGTPGTWTITKAGQLVIPQPSSFSLLSDTTDAWQVNLLIDGGTQSCNYAHVAGATEISSGNGCSVSTSYMTVNVGDVVTLSISTGVTQTASVGITLVENN